MITDVRRALLLGRDQTNEITGDISGDISGDQLGFTHGGVPCCKRNSNTRAITQAPGNSQVEVPSQLLAIFSRHSRNEPKARL